MLKNIKKITVFLCGVVFCASVAVLGQVQAIKAAEEINIDEISFPDRKFRNYVTKEFDKNGDGILSEEEVSSVKNINVYAGGIKNLKGVEYFTNLESLNCCNNYLESVDISNNIALTAAYFSQNQLTDLDVSNNKMLKSLDCSDNKLTVLDLSNNTELIAVNCYFNNQLSELKLNSRIYNKQIGILDSNIINKVSDMQNMTQLEKTLNIIDITKPASCKIDGRYFTIVCTDTVITTDPAPTQPPSPSITPMPAVTPSPTVVPSDIHIFSDYSYTNPVTGPSIVIYGNGTAQTVGGRKVNNRIATVYTDILASYKYTVNAKGVVKPSAGKVIVGITKSPVKPEVNSKNKITDTSASKIAKAKIKNGQITVTALGREGGLVYLWVLDTGNKGVSACCPVDVKLVPRKLEVQDISGTKLSNPKLENGKTLAVCLTGTAGTVKAEDGTYTASVDSKYSGYVTVTPVEGSKNKFTIKATGLKNDKDTKVSVNFKCNENGKKIKFSLTITK